MGSYITCTLTLFSQFETLSRVEPASVRGWLCNINSLCCCFRLMFSDSLAGSVLCLRGHMKRTLELIEDKYAQRLADCFPLFALFSASVCNNGFSCPEHSLNRLWVIRPLTPLLSLSVWPDAMHCIKCRTFFSPKTILCLIILMSSEWHKANSLCQGWHPARRPFSVGTKPKIALQICFSVVYISVSRWLYTCT